MDSSGICIYLGSKTRAHSGWDLSLLGFGLRLDTLVFQLPILTLEEWLICLPVKQLFLHTDATKSLLNSSLRCQKFKAGSLGSSASNPLVAASSYSEPESHASSNAPSASDVSL